MRKEKDPNGNNRKSWRLSCPSLAYTYETHDQSDRKDEGTRRDHILDLFEGGVLVHYHDEIGVFLAISLERRSVC